MPTGPALHDYFAVDCDWAALADALPWRSDAHLVLALGHRHQHQPEIFSQVIRGRADQIADVLDEEKIELMQIPVL